MGLASSNSRYPKPFIQKIAKKIVVSVSRVSAAVRLRPRSENVHTRKTTSNKIAAARNRVFEFQSFKKSGNTLSRMIARVGRTTSTIETITAATPITRTYRAAERRGLTRNTSARTTMMIRKAVPNSRPISSVNSLSSANSSSNENGSAV